MVIPPMINRAIRIINSQKMIYDLSILFLKGNRGNELFEIP